MLLNAEITELLQQSEDNRMFVFKCKNCTKTIRVNYFTAVYIPPVENLGNLTSLGIYELEGEFFMNTSIGELFSIKNLIKITNHE